MLELYKAPSRRAITSGALNTVPDKSVFMRYFLKKLNDNEKTLISAGQLFNSFKIAVINNSPRGQKPQYGIIGEAGDEGGDFIFLNGIKNNKKDIVMNEVEDKINQANKTPSNSLKFEIGAMKIRSTYGSNNAIKLKSTSMEITADSIIFFKNGAIEPYKIVQKVRGNYYKITNGIDNFILTIQNEAGKKRGFIYSSLAVFGSEVPDKYLTTTTYYLKAVNIIEK